MADTPVARDRRSMRLCGYDYGRQGAYFVTICTQDRANRFGTVADGTMQLNDAGQMVCDIWDGLPVHYPGVDIDAVIVMPDHVHGIIVLTGDVGPSVGAGPRARPMDDARPRGCPIDEPPDGIATLDRRAQGPAPTNPARPDPAKRLSLPDVVHRFKSLTTARYRHGVVEQGWPPFDGRLWQRNYHEHIIRDDGEMARIRRYIATNPARFVGAGPCACPVDASLRVCTADPCVRPMDAL